MKNNIKKIIKDNPKVNCLQLNEVQTVIKELRSNGVNKKSYNIMSPFIHKPRLQIENSSI